MSDHAVGGEPDLQSLWGRCLSRFDDAQGAPVRMMLQDCRPITMEGQRLTVGVPAPFTRDFLAKPEHSVKIAAILKEVLGQDVQVDFVAVEARSGNGATHHPEPLNGRPPGVHQGGSSHSNEFEGSSKLLGDYTFENFVRGNSNNLAAAAAQAVSDSPAKAFNPLFIYGGVGLGKTHLMHAIGNVVLSRNRRKRVVYISAERFTNEMIDSIGDAAMKDFRKKYRNVDVLLVDDIQFLVNKERTQEEFFHTFNELHSNAKQIVISSDRPPKQMPTLQDRLRSRFEWGMIADIQPPDLETRVAILRKKAELFETPVHQDVVDFIAEKIHSNIRELEGALTRVVTFCSLTGRALTMNSAAEALQDILRDGDLKVVDVPSIKTAVCEYFGISHEELIGKRRDQRIVRPRQIAMYLCKEMTNASYPEIGTHFGHKDHTTVIHAHRKVESHLDDHYFKTSLANLRERLKEFTR